MCQLHLAGKRDGVVDESIPHKQVPAPAQTYNIVNWQAQPETGIDYL